MNRDEAIAVLKSIFDRCSHLDASAITLMASTTTRAEGSSNYSIHMSATLNSDCRRIVADIAKEHGLVFKELEGGRLTIYRSKI